MILNDVHVPDDFVFIVEGSDRSDPVEVTGYIWFQLAVSSTYLGIVSGLVERLLEAGKGTPEERGWVLAQIDTQAAAIDGIAYGLDAREDRETAPGAGPVNPARHPGGHREDRHEVPRSFSGAWRSSALPMWPTSCVPAGPWPSTRPAASRPPAHSTRTAGAASST